MSALLKLESMGASKKKLNNGSKFSSLYQDQMKCPWWMSCSVASSVESWQKQWQTREMKMSFPYSLECPEPCQVVDKVNTGLLCVVLMSLVVIERKDNKVRKHEGGLPLFP